MDKDCFYISYSPCGVFSEFVGENNTEYKPHRKKFEKNINGKQNGNFPIPMRKNH